MPRPLPLPLSRYSRPLPGIGAALGRGGRNRGEALAIEPLRLSTRSPDRVERSDPEFGSLLDEPVEPSSLQRREQEPNVARRFGRPQLLLDLERIAIAAGIDKPAKPFACGLVEHRNRRSGTEAQHVAKSVRLRRIECDRLAGDQFARVV